MGDFPHLPSPKRWYHAETDQLETIPNNKSSIKTWLKTLSTWMDITIEAINIYHLEFADLAHKAGCVIYMVGGYEQSCCDAAFYSRIWS